MKKNKVVLAGLCGVAAAVSSIAALIEWASNYGKDFSKALEKSLNEGFTELDTKCAEGSLI